MPRSSCWLACPRLLGKGWWFHQQKTDHPSEQAEMALAHKVADKIEQAYRRGASSAGVR